MELGYIDIVIIIAYITALYAIARSARLFMQKKALDEGVETNLIQNHYIAGKSITFWELLLSIVATEFSAMAFLMIPTYVYYENLSFIRFILDDITIYRVQAIENKMRIHLTAQRLILEFIQLLSEKTLFVSLSAN